VGVDPSTIILALVGVGAAVGLAVVAGTVSARVFFDASRDPEDELQT
jgi:hypothetical protein